MVEKAVYLERRLPLTHSELIDYCRLSFEEISADCPFKDGENIVLRHKENGKWFALLFARNKRAYVNLKCDPQKADFRRSVYAGVQPGWHMNKRHWNTVDLQSDIPDRELYEMLADSYTLTACK